MKKYWKVAIRYAQSLLLSRLNNPNFSGFPHRRGVPSLLSFLWPPLDLLQQLLVCPVLRTPELDTGPQVGSHQSGAEGQNPLPCPAGHASLGAAQDTAGLLGCECSLPGHVHLLGQRYPQVLLGRAALNPFIPQPVLNSEGCPDPCAGPCTSPC